MRIYYQIQGHEGLSILVSSYSFTVFSLILRSLIHFELIFIHGVRKKSYFVPLHVDIQLS